MVNSSLYERLFGGKRRNGNGGGGGSASRHSPGFHAFNMNLVGGSGKRKGKGGSGSGDSFMKLLNDKKEFLLMVFSNLIVQLGITYYFMINYKDNDKDNKGIYWPLVGAQLFIIFILALVPMPSWLKFILFSIFSACFGIMFSILNSVVSKAVVQTAIFGTMSIFGLMFLFGAVMVMFGIQLGYQFASFLFCALLLLIIIRIVVLFMGKSSMVMKGLALAGLVLFSLYVIYDTNHILQRDYSGDFITASLDYYFDILNIFINLVSLDR
jgi:FtsH-binding integral membrane protein